MLARAQGVRAKCRGSRGQSPLLVSSVGLGPPQPGRIPNNVRFAQNGNLASNSPTDSAKAPLFFKRMFRYAIIALCLALPLHAEIAHDSTVLLWPKGAPQAIGDKVTDQPALTIHFPPEDKANGAAVIVNPGGGYQILASDHEGLQAARELNRHGITAFVLRYRLKPDYQPAVALLDGQRAIRHVRTHAKNYGVDPRRIGMLGFSAGGHLTAAVGTAKSEYDLRSDDPVERVSSRPDFLVPIYPAISKTLFPKARQENETWGSLEKQVTKDTPPTFLVHTHEDGLSPNHSVYFLSGPTRK